MLVAHTGQADYSMRVPHAARGLHLPGSAVGAKTSVDRTASAVTRQQPVQNCHKESSASGATRSTTGGCAASACTTVATDSTSTATGADWTYSATTGGAVWTSENPPIFCTDCTSWRSTASSSTSWISKMSAIFPRSASAVSRPSVLQPAPWSHVLTTKTEGRLPKRVQCRTLWC